VRWWLAASVLLSAFALEVRAQEAPPPEPPPEPPAEEPPPEQAPDEEVLTPPSVVETVDPTYPPEEVASNRHPTVVMHVTIDPDGRVHDAHVDESAGEHFDREALAAVRRWRFEPARRGDRPIAARVRVEVRFAPDFDVPQVENPPAHEHPEPALEEPTQPERGPRLGVEAHIDREEAEPERTASEHTIDRGVIDAAPRQDVGSVLQTVPSLFAARGEGDAVGHRLMLRGFDADHGQDIELTVDGIPINLPSHIHGQGYADLGFVLPETVRALRVVEGVYDPSQGDFAVAGSIDFRLGVPERDRGVASRTTYGSFNTFRQLVLWAPRGEHETTFGAAQYRRSDGYGEGRASEGGTAIVSLSLGDRPWNGRVIAIANATRASLAGVLRTDDIEADRVGFHDRYDDPSAEAQSALAIRFILGASAERRGERGERTRAALWASYDDFRIQSNFTGYTQRSRLMPEWVGRGDLIEQRNETISVGLRASHQSELYELADWLRGSVEVGLAGRADVIEQAQSLLAAPQNETWDQRVDASITGADIGAWLDLDFQITDYVRLRGGVRGDALFYDVDDRLGNFIPAFRRESYIVGFRRSAFGIAAGPRLSLEVRPIEPLSFTIAYGEGYRSPQARQLADGESAPFTKVRSGDLGVRLSLGDELELAGTAFMTFLSDDVVFEPREGRLEPVGPTSRIGGVLYARTQPLPWLTGALSVTYVHATIDEPPPASAEDPTPAFEEGSLLPFVPPWVVRADLGARERLFDIDGHPFRGHIGIGFSFLSPRPLPFGREADPVALLDAEIGASWRWFSIGVSAFNVLDTRWSASELFFVSDWRPSEVPSRLPARHIAAGAPLTVLGTLGITL
jgi:iron complex outermembrane receptor protein